MSLVLALCNRDTVVVAVDSWLTYQSDEARAINFSVNLQKYTMPNNHCALIHWGNDHEISAAFWELVDRQRNKKALYASDMAMDIARGYQALYEHLTEKIGDEKPKPDLNLCIAGLDYEGVGIYTISYDTKFLLKKWDRVFSAGVNEVSEYWLSKLWEYDLSKSQLERLALWCQVETAHSNKYVGGDIHIVTIQNGLIKPEIKTIGISDQVRIEIKDKLSNLINGWCEINDMKSRKGDI